MCSSDLFYVCNNVSADEMRYAVDRDIMISVDSLSQLALYGKNFPGTKVSVRVNPGIGAGHHQKVVTGGKTTKFGINLDKIEDILKIAEDKEEKPFVLVLDGITDTNNLGSIIRSAECAGVHGIILPKRRSATLNATVAKVAAGALEYVSVARVTNLVQTLRTLKNEGLWIIGADMDGETNFQDADLTGPTALVIGSEGEGLARLVKDECDLMVKIPMKGKISSLNEIGRAHV